MTHTLAYTYNGDGVRVASAVDGAEVRFAVMDQVGLPQVLVEVTGTHVITYLYGLARLAQLEGSEMEWHLGDALGSVRQLVGGDGEVILAREYSPFGELLSESGTGNSGYAFTGEQVDATTGLVFLRARWMDPYLNRFLSPDTIIPDFTNPQSLNRYTYVLNNAVRYTDPSGHCIPGYNCPGDTPSRPRIIPRIDWGARVPGVYDSWPARWFRGCGGCEEGFYDPEHNIEGYACYSDLKPGASLADILNMVVVHHEGDDQTYDVGKVQRKHIFGRGWVDIAYHFIVGRDGTLYEGRDIGVRGTHVIGQNSGKIGVLLLGDFQPGLRLPVVPIRVPDFRKGDDPGPTKAQVDSTLSLLRWLDYQYGIDEVRGHRDVEDQDTDCPGDSCMPWIPIFDEAVKEW